MGRQLVYQGRGIVAASPSVYPFFPHSYLACFSSIPMLSLLCTFSFCPSSKKIIFPHSHYYTGAWAYLYGGEKKGLQILLSYSQAGPGRKAKLGQEEISRNHLFSLLCIVCSFVPKKYVPLFLHRFQEHISWAAPRSAKILGHPAILLVQMSRTGWCSPFSPFQFPVFNPLYRPGIYI